MSKRKQSRQKEVPGKSAGRQISASDTAEKSSFLASFSKMIFVVVLVLASALAIYNALGEKDVVNSFIEENLPNLLRTEGMLFGLIAAGFVYCAFKLVFKLAEKRYDYLVLGVVFAAISFNFSLSFDKDIGSFGDNASYIINSKSLLEYGGPYQLYHIDRRYDYKAALGLPIMLTPIVAVWGMDVYKMKLVVFALGCLALLFFFLAFKRKLGIYAAAILAILLGTYPLIIYNTSYVMTEVPFLFAMGAALYFTFRFMDAESLRSAVLWGILTVIFSILSYLTRAVGIGVIAGTMMWFFLWVPWRRILTKQESLFQNITFRKFVVISAVLGIFAVGWQLRTPGSSVEVDAEGIEQVVPNKSQAGTFVEKNLAENFKRNNDLVKPLWAQQVFSKKLSRWYLSLGKAARIKVMGGKESTTDLVLFNYALILALLVGLIRRRLVAYWFLLIMLATLLGSDSKVSIVFSRYLIVVLPFVLFLFFDMLIGGAKWLSERAKMPALEWSGVLGAVLFGYFMLSHNFSGAAFNNQRQNAGDTYTIAFDNYIKSAEWIKKNTDEDAVVASRKPRLYYVFSERVGVMTVSYASQNYSEEVEEEILSRMIDRGASYLILDGFSTASRKVVLPIVQNNPDKFQIVESVGEKYPAYIIKFTPGTDSTEVQVAE